MTSLNAFLLESLETAARGLRLVTRKKLFGCEALFADGTMFALVWKTGRIALKLRDEGARRELTALPGTEPWSPSGGKTMGGWLLVPESFHDEDDDLRLWVHRAHAQALDAAGSPEKAPRRASPVKKKAGATKSKRSVR